jgi:hypothetical protein
MATTKEANEPVGSEAQGDASDDGVLPPPQPSPTTPLTWKQLVVIISSGDLAKLRRSPAQQADYDRYMETQVRAVWETTADFILCTKFDLAVGRHKTTAKQVALRPQHAESRLRLVPNDFPYSFDAEHVDHWILWKWQGGPVTPEELEAAQAKLRAGNLLISDLRHWVNPPSLQSIPQIHHVHIVCQRRSSEPDGV